MPNKKQKTWMMGNKGPTGPWVWHAWIKGSKKPTRVVAFDLDHIRCQLEGKQVLKAVKQPEEKDEYFSPTVEEGCSFFLLLPKQSL